VQDCNTDGREKEKAIEALDEDNSGE